MILPKSYGHLVTKAQNKIQSFSEYDTNKRLFRRIIRMNPVTKQN